MLDLDQDAVRTNKTRPGSTWGMALGKGSKNYGGGSFSVVFYKPLHRTDPIEQYESVAKIRVSEAASFGAAEPLVLDQRKKQIVEMYAAPVSAEDLYGLLWQLLDVEPSDASPLLRAFVSTTSQPGDTASELVEDGLAKLCIATVEAVETCFGGLGENEHEWRELFHRLRNVVNNRLNPPEKDPQTTVEGAPSSKWQYNPTPRETLEVIEKSSFNFQSAQELRHTTLMVFSQVFPNVKVAPLDGQHRELSIPLVASGRELLDPIRLSGFLDDHARMDQQLPPMIPQTEFGPSYMSNMRNKANITVYQLHKPEVFPNGSFGSEDCKLLYSFSQKTQDELAGAKPAEFRDYAQDIVRKMTPLAQVSVTRNTFILPLMIEQLHPKDFPHDSNGNDAASATLEGDSPEPASAHGSSVSAGIGERRYVQLWPLHADDQVCYNNTPLPPDWKEKLKSNYHITNHKWTRDESAGVVYNRMEECSRAYQDKVRCLFFPTQKKETAVVSAKKVEEVTTVDLYQWLVRRNKKWSPHDTEEPCIFHNPDNNSEQSTMMLSPGYSEKETCNTFRSTFACVIIEMALSENTFGKKIFESLAKTICQQWGSRLGVDEESQRYAAFLVVFDLAMEEAETNQGYMTPKHGMGTPPSYFSSQYKETLLPARAFIGVAFILTLAIIGDEEFNLAKDNSTWAILASVMEKDSVEEPRTDQTCPSKQFLNQHGHVIAPFALLQPFQDLNAVLTPENLKVFIVFFMLFLLVSHSPVALTSVSPTPTSISISWQ